MDFGWESPPIPQQQPTVLQQLAVIPRDEAVSADGTEPVDRESAGVTDGYVVDDGPGDVDNEVNDVPDEDGDPDDDGDSEPVAEGNPVADDEEEASDTGTAKLGEAVAHVIKSKLATCPRMRALLWSTVEMS
jgi:hypothetical protein